MKLHMQTPHESRMCHIDFEVRRSKVKVTMHKLLKMFPAHNCFPFTPIIMKLYMQTRHEARMCPVDSRVKGQGHSALISGNGFLRITAFPLHPFSQNFTGTLLPSQGYALLISGSKGQRSRSQCINYYYRTGMTFSKFHLLLRE